ncbi:MAG: FAD-linked oxidase C-terminal domain-containing protein, partial [Pseudobdellovibrio sp.]
DITEAMSHRSPYKNDISVSVSKVPEFMQNLDEVFSKNYPTWEVVWFGHIGDGNLHISILRPDGMTKEEFVKECRKVDVILFEGIKKLQGSISAEHGVGLTKKPFLNYTRSESEIELMRGIKKVFDPDMIMNPGKVI